MRITVLRWRAARLLLASALLVTLAWAAPAVNAQDNPQQPTTTTQQDKATEHSTQTASHAQTNAPAAAPANQPLYREFRGIAIGTSADEARQKLGNPQDKSDVQDFFVFSDAERARVYYDDKGKVSAIIVTYVGKNSNAPTPVVILGADIEPKEDGSLYKMVMYPEAGYWVAYSRTSGDDALTMITMQKMP